MKEFEIYTNINNLKVSLIMVTWTNPWDGCGGTPPGGGYSPISAMWVCRYVPPQRVWFLSRFGLKTGIDFDHYGLKSGYGFQETRERINVFVFSTPNE